MIKCYLDSNVLIYFKDENSPHHKNVVAKITGLISEGAQIFISPLVLDEVIYVVKYQLTLQKTKTVFADLKKLIQDILQIPSLIIVNPPISPGKQLEVITLMQKYHLSVRDAYHLVTILGNNLNYFASFDNDFRAVFADGIIKTF